MNLYEEFKNLVETLNREGVGYALCGGLAMAVYDLPRATMDIDLLVLTDDLGKAKALARDCGFTIDTGVFAIASARSEIHRMVKVSGADEEPIVLDLLRVGGELDDVWSSRQQMQWEGGTLCVVSRDGLVKMKRLRGNKKDQYDIGFLTGNES